MQKIIVYLLIALSGIGYGRAQFVFQPTEEDLKPRPIPQGQTINVSQLIGTDWRIVYPYYGAKEEIWRFSKDSLRIFYYTYKTKEWTYHDWSYYLSADTAYTYDEKDFDTSKVGKTQTGICIVKKINKPDALPHYLRVVKFDYANKTMELFRKRRWNELGIGDCYIKLEENK